MNEEEKGGRDFNRGHRREAPCRAAEIIKQLNKSAPSSSV